MPKRSKSPITIEDLGPPQRVTTAPGVFLKEDFMEPFDLSANALARALHVPPNRITGIVNGERAVTADTALRLSRYFGTTADFWLNAQKSYELSKARLESEAKIEREIRPREENEKEAA